MSGPLIADASALFKFLGRAVRDAQKAGALEELEATYVLRSIIALISVLQDLNLGGVEGQASYLALRAWQIIIRETIVKALEESKADKLDRMAQELAKELRKQIPIYVDIQGRPFPDLGG